jgi:hypothetical protein
MEVVETMRLGLVPRAGVEPARPYGQRILSPVEGILPDLTKRDDQYLPDWQPSKSRFVRLRLATKCRHLSVIVKREFSKALWPSLHLVVP